MCLVQSHAGDGLPGIFRLYWAGRAIPQGYPIMMKFRLRVVDFAITAAAHCTDSSWLVALPGCNVHVYLFLRVLLISYEAYYYRVGFVT